VVRTAKSLGYSGLPELKRSVGATLATQVRPSAILRQRIEQVDSTPGAVIGQIAEEAIELIHESRRLLEQSPLAEAVALLAGAREIVTYGYGPSGLSARYLELKLNRMGRRARSFSTTGFAFADELMQIREGHAVVMFAPARGLRELDALVGHANAVGAHTMLITNSLGHRFAGRVEVVLPAPFGVPGRTNAMIGEMMTIDALLSTLAGVDEPCSLASSDLLNELRQTILGDA
jgi:DNA-binding MurR/RpiR family transcriptional regulator